MDDTGDEDYPAVLSQLYKYYSLIQSEYARLYSTISNKRKFDRLVKTLYSVASSRRFVIEELKTLDINCIRVPSKVVGAALLLDELISPTIQIVNLHLLNIDDIEWIIWHEFGHYRDFLDGKLTMDSEYITYKNTKYKKEHVLHLLQCATQSGPINSKTYEYAALEHEYSANLFAKVNSTCAPVNDGLLVGYNMVTFAQTYIDINK